MTTTQIDHNAEKSRSYQVRLALPNATPGYDWSNNLVDWPVHVAARRNIVEAGIVKGEVIQIVSTSNAGFSGIVATGYRHGQLVNLGSLGAWDVV